MKKFKTQDWFPRELFEQIAEIRVDNPDIIIKQAKKRKRRPRLTEDGKLAILAADHPARMATKAGSDPIAMGDRYGLLGRVLRVLSLPEWDGVMGATDLLEELLILDHLIVKRGGKSLLDDRVLIGSMNRGGLAETVFEMDDRLTSFTAESIQALNLDGGKLLLRLAPQSEDSAKTIEYCVQAINDLNKYDIPIFLEPLPVDEKYKVIKEAEALVKIVGVATALGDSSRNIWLKIPYCKEFENVARATTCPILMLGGAVKESAEPLLAEFYQGMQAGKNVRGVLVGRNVLFPGDDDPRAVAAAVSGIVHAGLDVNQAQDRLAEERGKDTEVLS